MTEFISSSWVITLLAIYMLAFGAYATSQHPDPGKRKKLAGLQSIGIIAATLLIIYNALIR